MQRETELIVAYHKVLSEARHVMALHRRIAMLLGVATADADKLQAAIDRAARLEQEIGEAELAKGNTQ